MIVRERWYFETKDRIEEDTFRTKGLLQLEDSERGTPRKKDLSGKGEVEDIYRTLVGPSTQKETSDFNKRKETLE